MPRSAQSRATRAPRTFFNPRFVGTERRRAYRLAYILFWSILLYFFFSRFVVGVGIVTDRSMYPTLHEGDYFLINKYLYRIRQPTRGEIVVLHPRAYDTDEYVKRVIALAGETLEIREGAVFINGDRLREPYAAGRTGPNLGPLIIRSDHCFVMGDNREDSFDSRRFGAVPRSNLQGKIKPGEWFPLG